MYDNRVAGELNITAYNEIRGVVRKFDYADIKQHMLQKLSDSMKARIGLLSATLISRITHAEEINALRETLETLSDQSIQNVVSKYGTVFDMSTYKTIHDAAHICHAFNGLVNRVKEYERGTLKSVYVTQDELYKIHWLRNNKQTLKRLVFTDYAHVLGDNTNG